ncbi:hypothetical protein OE88DRAFT_1668262 [Heliocybe sulcata]|uniref:Uncharacterized protein n=1 Tax=Heliocybe sulcata TaxID=5364 RepID=A0A5C3MMF1_9AGAM|nr:hypothetical protein OE88DRAFT_1668262 [Heliocybe sulcata]
MGHTTCAACDAAALNSASHISPKFPGELYASAHAVQILHRSLQVTRRRREGWAESQGLRHELNHLQGRDELVTVPTS